MQYTIISCLYEISNTLTNCSFSCSFKGFISIYLRDFVMFVQHTCTMANTVPSHPHVDDINAHRSFSKAMSKYSNNEYKV